ncbi:Peptidyl-prolyl cis-trans isomerase CYP40 [Hordeum vulgare]|nr:Peptidyl-prolyl cis-trans isomerase CYP40 [Hordeum vulgare]
MADTQPLRWHAEMEDTPPASSDSNMARACPSCEATCTGGGGSPQTVDVGEAESHSPVLRMVNHCGHRNRVVVDVGSFQEGSVISLTCTGTVWVTGSNGEERGMGDSGSLTPVNRLVSHVLLYFVGDQTDTMRGAASRRTWARQRRTSCVCY